MLVPEPREPSATSVSQSGKARTKPGLVLKPARLVRCLGCFQRGVLQVWRLGHRPQPRRLEKSCQDWSRFQRKGTSVAQGAGRIRAWSILPTTNDPRAHVHRAEWRACKGRNRLKRTRDRATRCRERLALGCNSKRRSGSTPPTGSASIAAPQALGARRRIVRARPRAAWGSGHDAGR